MKQRPFFNPLIVHIKSIAQLDELAKEIPDKARLLADKFWPGSLTMVFKKQDSVPDLITAGKDSVAVRIPNHPTTLALLEALDFPLAAPSANPFGSISPTNAFHVADYFADKLQMVLDGGACENGIESTIIGFENEEAVLYRLGSISVEDIEEVIGKVKIQNKKESAPNAPGMLSKHYSPTTMTFLKNDVVEFIKEFREKRIGLLLFKEKIESTTVIPEVYLQERFKGRIKLYSVKHRLERRN
jgi:L-threonylcarbamoyladenylate synthase